MLPRLKTCTRSCESVAMPTTSMNREPSGICAHASFASYRKEPDPTSAIAISLPLAASCLLPLVTPLSCPPQSYQREQRRPLLKPQRRRDPREEVRAHGMSRFSSNLEPPCLLS